MSDETPKSRADAAIERDPFDLEAWQFKLGEARVSTVGEPHGKAEKRRREREKKRGSKTTALFFPSSFPSLSLYPIVRSPRLCATRETHRIAQALESDFHSSKEKREKERDEQPRTFPRRVLRSAAFRRVCIVSIPG